MEYTDQNEYQRRIEVLHEIAGQHPDLLRTLRDEDRQVLDEYFEGAARAASPTEYRRELLKRHPTIELQANKAYERFLAEAGLPETLLRRA
jgi:hypothetical protein